MEKPHSSLEFPAHHRKAANDVCETMPGTPDLGPVFSAFAMGECLEVFSAGGTASPKWAVRTSRGRFLVRMRPTDFAAEDATRFDHEVMRRLSEAGLPVPAPVERRDGSTWLSLGGRVFEVLSWISGAPWDERNPETPRSIGAFLARFHSALKQGIANPESIRPREDHPDLLAPYLAGLRCPATNSTRVRLLEELERQLDLIRTRLDAGLYGSLPHCLIHGDLHPGNVRFAGSQVAALYDFDYVSMQARVRDLSDALLFFASRREQVFDPDDIRSLTQPMIPEMDRSRRLVEGYQSATRLTTTEWQALPLLMRSRWLQMRLRGARKVAQGERVDFVLHRFFEVIEWLDREGPAFFEELRRATRADEAHP
jgi:homoserine kinase type II